MEQFEYYKHLRTRIGNPDQTQVNQRDLESYSDAAMLWVAAQLKFKVKTETNIALVAGTLYYRLPQDCLWVVSVAWNSQKLTPSSTYKWDRDGTNFRSSTSVAVLSEFAVQSRFLVVNPPPSAAAITTDPFLTLRYLAGGKISEEDLLDLNDMACWVAIYKGAIMYLRAHPTEESQAMVQGYQEDLGEFLLQAKRQSFNPTEDYVPGFRPYTERRGGAR